MRNFKFWIGAAEPPCCGIRCGLTVDNNVTKVEVEGWPNNRDVTSSLSPSLSLGDHNVIKYVDFGYSFNRTLLVVGSDDIPVNGAAAAGSCASGFFAFECEISNITTQNAS